ncbi:hypothetical protein [Nostoc sp. NMS7]|nr:hypothetical protein [Nostoc sp. NMS7]
MRARQSPLSESTAKKDGVSGVPREQLRSPSAPAQQALPLFAGST